MPAVVLEAGLKAPTLIIVGEVVKLRDKLNWFGKTVESRE
jgi:uroporphyrin-III C-methyltransferase/precorrin-2 dehydrogenase/sirohydrochlorin ferrochelatase